MLNKVKFKNKITFRSSTNLKFAMDGVEPRKFPPFSKYVQLHPLSSKNTTSKLKLSNKALVIDMCWSCILKVLQMNHLYIKFLEWTHNYMIYTWDIYNHFLTRRKPKVGSKGGYPFGCIYTKSLCTDIELFTYAQT